MRNGSSERGLSEVMLLQAKMAELTNQLYPVGTPTQNQTYVNMERMIHSHDETVDQTKVLPKMEHIRGENILNKKAEQLGEGGFC